MPFSETKKWIIKDTAKERCRFCLACPAGDAIFVSIKKGEGFCVAICPQCQKEKPDAVKREIEDAKKSLEKMPTFSSDEAPL